MHYALCEYFTDPLIRASSLGTLFLGASSGLIGGLLILRRASLMAETMSHASYPGLMLGVLVLASFGYNVRDVNSLWQIDAMAFVGAACGAMLGLGFYSWLLRLRVPNDSALCWVLSSFLGLGVLMASRLQFMAPRLYQRAQSFLYGQASTLVDWHVVFFAGLWLVTLISVWLFFRAFLVAHFDPTFAKTQHYYPRALRVWLHLLTIALMVTGIRGGGVLVMSALLVAPAITARLLTYRLSYMLVLSMLLGALTAFVGNAASLEVDFSYMDAHEPGILPTGPSIALVGCAMAWIACFFAPQQGVIAKLWRRQKLRAQWKRKLYLTEQIHHE